MLILLMQQKKHIASSLKKTPKYHTKWWNKGFPKFAPSFKVVKKNPGKYQNQLFQNSENKPKVYVTPGSLCSRTVACSW
jgi:hypothetical protein